MPTRLKYNNVGDVTGSANPATLSTSTTTTITWPSAPSNLPTIASPDYVVLVLEPNTVNEEIVYLTAYTAGATSGTVTRAQEGTTGQIHTSVAWVNGPTLSDFTQVVDSSIPAGLYEGQAYYNIQTGTQYVWNGAAWVPEAGAQISTYVAGTSTVSNVLDDGYGSTALSGSMKSGPVRVKQIAAPVPTLSIVGTPGTTTIQYYVYAVDSNGNATMSAMVQTTTAPATLSATNYVKVSWPKVPGAVSYYVCRNTTSASIGSVYAQPYVTTVSMNDTGLASGSLTTSSLLLDLQDSTGTRVLSVDNTGAATFPNLPIPTQELRVGPGGATNPAQNATVGSAYTFSAPRANPLIIASVACDISWISSGFGYLGLYAVVNGQSWLGISWGGAAMMFDNIANNRLLANGQAGGILPCAAGATVTVQLRVARYATGGSVNINSSDLIVLAI